VYIDECGLRVLDDDNKVEHRLFI